MLAYWRHRSCSVSPPRPADPCSNNPAPPSAPAGTSGCSPRCRKPSLEPGPRHWKVTSPAETGSGLRKAPDHHAAIAATVLGGHWSSSAAGLAETAAVVELRSWLQKIQSGEMLSLNGILSAKLGVTLNSVGFFQFPHLHSESITESKKRFCTNSTMLVDLMLTLQWCFIDMFCVYFPQVFFCCYSRECWQRSCLCSVLRCSEAECNDFSSNSNSFSKGPWFKSLSQPLNPSALFDLSETCQEKYETLTHFQNKEWLQKFNAMLKN